MNTNVKYALGAGIVTMVLLFAVMAAFAPMSDVAVAAPAAAPTPVANYPAADYTFAVFQPATAITADTNTNWVPVERWSKGDFQTVIDQTNVNTVTVTLQFSNDGVNIEDGAVLVSANAADADDLEQYFVFGRYARINYNVTNTNTVTVATTAVLKQ